MTAPRRVPPNVPRDVHEWERAPDAPQVQGGGIGMRAGTQMQPLGRALMVPPPWMYPPGDAARYIFREEDTTLAAGPVVQTELAGSVFQIPAQNVAVIRELNFSVNNMLITSDITFRVTFNQAPVEGYTFKLFPRAAASVSVAFPAESTVLHVPEAVRVAITVQVGDAGAYQVGCSWRGWFHSKDIHNRFKFYG